jgi:hypothetical protein
MIPSVWRTSALQSIHDENCFGTVNDFQIFPFYVGVVDGSLLADNSVIIRSITHSAYIIDVSAGVSLINLLLDSIPAESLSAFYMKFTWIITMTFISKHNLRVEDDI